MRERGATATRRDTLDMARHRLRGRRHGREGCHRWPSLSEFRRKRFTRHSAPLVVAARGDVTARCALTNQVAEGVVEQRDDGDEQHMQTKSTVVFPMFAEAEDECFLLALQGAIWRVGQTYYLLVAGRWFRLGMSWQNGLDGGRVCMDAWLPSRGPRPGAMGVRLQEAPKGPNSGRVVDNTKSARLT